MVIIIKPLFIIRGLRIPDPQLIGIIVIVGTIESRTREGVRLETLAVNRGEVDAESIEVALGDVFVDIPDKNSATDFRCVRKSVAESMCCENAAKGRKETSRIDPRGIFIAANL